MKKIAIFTDAHALFEPTEAVLKDIKGKGITEIYSLGDNIGIGPNPRKVMDLFFLTNPLEKKTFHLAPIVSSESHWM